MSFLLPGAFTGLHANLFQVADHAISTLSRCRVSWFEPQLGTRIFRKRPLLAAAIVWDHAREEALLENNNNHRGIVLRDLAGLMAVCGYDETYLHKSRLPEKTVKSIGGSIGGRLPVRASRSPGGTRGQELARRRARSAVSGRTGTTASGWNSRFPLRACANHDHLDN